MWAALISERSILLGKNKLSDQQSGKSSDGGIKSDLALLEYLCRRAEKGGFRAESCSRDRISANGCRQVFKTFRYFKDICANMNIPVKSSATADLQEALKCLISAFPDHIAMKRHASTLIYQLQNGRSANLAKESTLADKDLILAVEIREVGSGKGVKTILSSASEVRLDWLQELLPGSLKHIREQFFNPVKKQVLCRQQHLFKNLIISEKQFPADQLDKAAEILSELVSDGTLQLKNWNKDVKEWILKVRCLAQWFPEKNLLTYNETDIKVILQEICSGSTSYKEIRSKPCLDYVRNALSWQEQEFVRKSAPDKIQLPGGRFIKIRYRSDAAPLGRAFIQDLFGMQEIPVIAQGRQKLLLEILAPNHRPVQITDDLSGFWKNLYPSVKKELSRRYPKHQWL